MPDVIASIHTALSGSGATSPTTWRRRCESQSATVTPQRANHSWVSSAESRRRSYRNAVARSSTARRTVSSSRAVAVFGETACSIASHSPHALAASITAAQSTASPSIVKTVRDRTSTGVTRATGHERPGPRTGGRAWRR